MVGVGGRVVARSVAVGVPPVTVLLGSVLVDVATTEELRVDVSTGVIVAVGESTGVMVMVPLGLVALGVTAGVVVGVSLLEFVATSVFVGFV